MSKIDELLKDEKVEWKRLGDVSEIGTGKSNTNKQDESGEFPFYVRSKDIKRSKNYEFDETAIIIPGEGGIGEVFHYVIGKYALHQRAYRIHITDQNINTRFIYHYMKQNFKKYITKFAVSATVKSIRKPMIENFEIPIPPIETQEKIVKILDKFTECVTELQAELQARVKQYEYYRDKLLSEDYLNKLTKEFYSLEKIRVLEYVKISELCLRQRGIKITAEQMKNLDREDSSVKVFAGGSTTANLLPEEVGVENIINKPSVIVKSRGNIDFEYYDQPFTHKNEMWSYSTLNEDKLNIKYLYYVLKNNLKYFTDNAISGKLPQISTGVTDNYKVPLPNILVQNIVVEILDKFQSLVSETKGLLPQEIEHRQKQYEFYREKLFNFDDKVVNTHTHTHTQLISSSYFDILREACDIAGIKMGQLKKLYLKDITTYSNNKINITELNETNYVGVDNLLKNKLGKVDSKNVPTSGSFNLFREGDILIGNIRPYLRKIWISDIEGGASPDVLVIRKKDSFNNNLLSKYLYQVLSSEQFFDYDIKHSKGAKMPRGNKAKIMDFEILVPPLYVQEYVVSILDKFDSLINDINEGLPKEIELRQKQYEYYREKLLDFPR